MQLKKSVLGVEKKYSSIVAKAQKEAEAIIFDAEKNSQKEADALYESFLQEIEQKKVLDKTNREEHKKTVLSHAKLQADDFLRPKKREAIKKELLSEVLDVSF